MFQFDPKPLWQLSRSLMSSISTIDGLLVRRDYTSFGATNIEEYPMHIVDRLGGSIFQALFFFPFSQT